MATYQVRVKVEIGPCTEAPTEKPTKQQDGSFQITLTDTDAIRIDRGEQALVQTAYPTFREALSTHLSAMSKKKPMSI
jgi:hypothetical protein